MSGADISEFDQARDSAEAAAVYNQTVAEAQDALARFPAPTVALIQGACMGGGIGLALACDLRYASASARFRMPAARLGLGYGYADMRRVVAVTGMAAAFELFTPPAPWTPNRRRPADCCTSVSRWTISSGSPRPACNASPPTRPCPCGRRKRRYWHPCANSAAELETIAALVRQCFDSADYAEGRRAFAERRDPFSPAADAVRTCRQTS